MKKNISINIGGIIFHIEEDGYEKLKSYLDSVNHYFSTFEDSREIIEDIEGRIAELFLAKLDDGKQIITAEDINDLIKTMGTTKDFEASIESAPEEPTGDPLENDEKSEPNSKAPRQPRRLYRDTRRKLLGGVASGIAHYFGIDAIWIRLILLALLFNILLVELSGFSLIVYIVLWIAVPASDKLDDDKAIKKLFRSSEDRVLGGVAGGISSYFGTDPVAIRVLFVVSMLLGGAGFILYLILWIITPEARSITEKMQMQGEPVTLSGIEKNVKESLNVKEGEESVFVKILLFPFRLISLIFKTLGEALGPLMKFGLEALRIIAGIFLVALGFIIMVSLTIALAVLFGVGGVMESWVHFGEFPASELAKSVGTWTFIAAYLTLIIPSLAVALVGMVVLLKRNVVNVIVGWSMFGLWLLGLVGVAISLPGIIRNYSTEATFHEERTLAPTAEVIALALNDLDLNDYGTVALKIRGHEDSLYLLDLEYESRGFSRSDAKENADAVDYNITLQDSTIYFDSDITFGDAPFRFQGVEATFYIPHGQVFTLDESLERILRNTLWIHGYSELDLGSNEWVFDKDGLNCLTCKSASRERSSQATSSNTKRTYAFTDFDELTFISLFDFEIEQSDTYAVELSGDEDLLTEVYLEQVGDELEIRYGKKGDWWSKGGDVERISVVISMPELAYINVRGACEGEINGFESKDLAIEISGASKVRGNIRAQYLEVDLAGASELTLIGVGKTLDAKLVGASKLNSFDYLTKDVTVDVSGASSARVKATSLLDASASGASKVRYRGDAEVTADSNGLSSVKRDE